MNISKNPPILKKTQKITVTNTPCEFDSNSSHCMLQVVSGDLYITGTEDAGVSNKSFKIAANTVFEFTGRIKLISDGTADARILFYEYV